MSQFSVQNNWVLTTYRLRLHGMCAVSPACSLGRTVHTQTVYLWQGLGFALCAQTANQRLCVKGGIWTLGEVLQAAMIHCVMLSRECSAGNWLDFQCFSLMKKCPVGTEKIVKCWLHFGALSWLFRYTRMYRKIKYLHWFKRLDREE